METFTGKLKSIVKIRKSRTENNPFLKVVIS